MTVRPLGMRVHRRLPDLLLGLACLVVLVGMVYGAAGGYPASFFYSVLVLVTVFVVRSVPVEPGAWLGLRSVRRVLVAVTALLTVDFLFMNQVDVPTLVALVLCDFALGRATRRLAGARDDVLDERQAVWRDRAYRTAYLLFAAAVGGVLVVADLATPGTRQWLGDAIQHGGAMVSFIELLAFLPSMVIAWTEPNRVSGADAPLPSEGMLARIAAALVILCLLVPVVFSFGLALGPIRTTSLVKPQAIAGAPATQCSYVHARKDVGVGFGATLPLDAVACWNGTTAFESWGLNASDCHPVRTDMVVVSTLECRRTTDTDGTLRFVYRAALRSAFLPFVGRDVSLTLVLSREGKVVQLP